MVVQHPGIYDTDDCAFFSADAKGGPNLFSTDTNNVPFYATRLADPWLKVHSLLREIRNDGAVTVEFQLAQPGGSQERS